MAQLLGCTGILRFQVAGVKESFTVKENIMGPKIVRVVSYHRYRFGKWEDVCTHLRSLPR